MSETLTSPIHSLTAMNRREAVRRIALLMGGAMIGSRLILSGQAMPDKTAAAFTDDDKALLDEIGETILPATDIPGAKATGIGAFMAMMVNDCYTDKEHAEFVAGMAKVKEASSSKYGKTFLALQPSERTDLLNEIYVSQRKHNQAPYFKMMKDLTLLGYFSSEIGCTKAVRYIEVPGAYHGDVPYKKGDPAWF